MSIRVQLKGSPEREVGRKEPCGSRVGMVRKMNGKGFVVINANGVVCEIPDLPNPHPTRVNLTGMSVTETVSDYKALGVLDSFGVHALRSTPYLRG